ncbi:hypothetical protein [Allorhizocola rhizosphaerae]|uniref:hypothetical protein n=1 Tax=Allorhizocola rhizosphaerae TaxID=1872709 RepID=UPI0013C2BE7B|nr:hypothetical protein [Allorhizocola rhizosphaerae]
MIGMLWATEPAPLPARTRIAFAALIVVGMMWAGFAAWALARRPLFAIDRLVAAALAVGFSVLTTIGAVAIALARSSAAGVLAAAGLGLTLVAIAATMLIRARAYRAALLARKRELQEPSDTTEGANMSTRKGLPIGPLALAMRHRGGTPGRRIAIAAVIVGLALAAGVALLLR